MIKLDRDTFRITETAGLVKGLLIVGIAGLLISLVGVFVDSLREQFYFSLLVSLIFWTTIAFGGLFFVMIHHLTNATWSVVVRRLAETVMVILPIMLIGALLIILPWTGLESLYTWSTAPATDHLLEIKRWWLNAGFFNLRTIIYIVAMFILTRTLYKLSIKQDKEPGDKLTSLMKNVSGPGMVAFALTITFSMFDYVMTLDYKWFSTIFGVYCFAGSVLSVLCFVTIIAYVLRSRDILADTITVEHYHDLGKLIFAFTVFWAYIGFSQFFLIWYGNMPEETDWFAQRWVGSWGNIALVVLFGHFIIPFLLLISRVPKRRPKLLVVMCFYMLAMHWVDVHWMIMPNLHKGGVTFSWLDLTTFVGVGGIFLWLFWLRLSSNPIIPVKDPRLPSSIHFTNA